MRPRSRSGTAKRKSSSGASTRSTRSPPIAAPRRLRDPSAYSRRLQASCRAALGVQAEEPFYVVVEKILEANEPLRPDWSVHPTTGYDYLNDLNGVFAARHHEQFFGTIY